MWGISLQFDLAQRWRNLAADMGTMRWVDTEDRSKLMIVSRKRRVLIEGRDVKNSVNTTYGYTTLKLPDVGKTTRIECAEKSILHKRPSRFVASCTSGYAIESPLVSRVPLIITHSNIPSVACPLTSILKCPPLELVATDDGEKRVRFQPTVVVQYFDDAGPICARRGLLHNNANRRRRVRSSGFKRCASVLKHSLLVSAAKRAGVPPSVLAG